MKDAIADVPIIANGNVIDWNDVVSNMEVTSADGIMSAEGLLNDPTLFSGAINGTPVNKDKLDIAIEYLDIVDEYPVPIKSVIFHVRRICSAYLEKYQLMVDLIESTDVNQVREIINNALSIRDQCLRNGVEYIQDAQVMLMSCNYFLCVIYTCHISGLRK